MKARVGVLLLLAAAGALGAIAVRARERTYVVPEHAEPIPIPFALEGEPPAGFTRRSFVVEGICCQGCGAKLKGALSSLSGVGAVAVDPLNARVTTFVRSDVSDEALERALTFDKYVATRER
jgi:copper chaperone CopZ